MTTFKVYWTDELGQVFGELFGDMTLALNCSNEKRKKYSYVSMSSENSDLVGKLGVDAVTNGKLPNGEEYHWRKRRK